MCVCDCECICSGLPSSSPWDCPHQGQTLQHKMNIRWVFQSPLSPSLLPLGATSLECPSSPLTRHKEKPQNMWRVSLIPSLPHATTASEFHVRWHLHNQDIWLVSSERKEKILLVVCLVIVFFPSCFSWVFFFGPQNQKLYKPETPVNLFYSVGGNSSGKHNGLDSIRVCTYYTYCMYCSNRKW